MTTTGRAGFGDTSRYATADPYTPRPWTAPITASRSIVRTTVIGMRRITEVAVPRGYQRSDARIFEDICDKLTVDPRVDASDIEVDCEGSGSDAQGQRAQP
jgi:hypothetical protein